MVNVFATSGLVSLLQKEGFHEIGRIPDSGTVYGKGWTDNIIFYKDFLKEVRVCLIWQRVHTSIFCAVFNLLLDVRFSIYNLNTCICKLNIKATKISLPISI